jgi:hypothetical protein
MTGLAEWCDRFDPTGDLPGRLQALLDAEDVDGAVAIAFGEIAGLSDNEVASMRRRPEWAGRLAVCPQCLVSYAPNPRSV